MTTLTKAIAGVVIVAVLAIGGYFAFHKGSPGSLYGGNNNGGGSAPSSQAPAAGGGNQSVAATITYTDSGFSPQTVTVKAGDKILIKNGSSAPMEFDSDPHPIHTDDPELNEGVIEPGASATITVNVKGTHGYHNHLDPSQTGTIIVE